MRWKGEGKKREKTGHLGREGATGTAGLVWQSQLAKEEGATGYSRQWQVKPKRRLQRSTAQVGQVRSAKLLDKGPRVCCAFFSHGAGLSHDQSGGGKSSPRSCLVPVPEGTWKGNRGPRAPSSYYSDTSNKSYLTLTPYPTTIAFFHFIFFCLSLHVPVLPIINPDGTHARSGGEVVVSRANRENSAQRHRQTASHSRQRRTNALAVSK